MIGLPIINQEVDCNERGRTMSLSFTIEQFRDMSKRDFYRAALRVILDTCRCDPEHEERLIHQLRREESTYP